MGTPHGTSTRGQKMWKGGLEAHKNGGAHESTHAESDTLNIDTLSHDINEKSSYFVVSNNVDDLSNIQDGGCGANIYLEDLMDTQTENIIVCDDNRKSGVNLTNDNCDIFPVSVGKTPTEWIKDGVDTYVIPQVHDKVSSRPRNLEMAEKKFGSDVNVTDLGFLINTRNGPKSNKSRMNARNVKISGSDTAYSLANTPLKVVSSNKSRSSIDSLSPGSSSFDIRHKTFPSSATISSGNASVTDRNVVDIRPTGVEVVTADVNLQGAANKSIKKEIMDSSLTFLVEQLPSESLKLEDHFKLSSQDKACLEELERGSQLTHEEQELLENSRQELEALEKSLTEDEPIGLSHHSQMAAEEMEKSLQEQKSSTIIIPQDLDQFVNIKHEGSLTQKIIKNSSNSTLMSPGSISLLSQQGKLGNIKPVSLPRGTVPNAKLKGQNKHCNPSKNLVKGSVISSCATSSQVSSAKIVKNTITSKNNTKRSAEHIQVNNHNTRAGNKPVTPNVKQNVEKCQPVTNSGSQPMNDIATVSISVDKGKDTTQVIVQTSSGQQIYEMNTSDLNLAAQAIQPNVSLPSYTSATSSNSGMVVIPLTSEPGTAGKQDTPTLNSTTATSHVQKLTVGSQSNTQKKFVCPEEGCGSSHATLSKLKRHAMTHSSERPFKCAEPGCEWAFTTSYKLKRHEESHSGKKNYICDVYGCGKKFTTVYNLRTHKKVHETPLTEICPEPECSEKFRTKKHLAQHIRTFHSQEKNYKCPHEGCDKTFFSSCLIGSHMRVHQTGKLYCSFEGCGREFTKPSRLRLHMRTHTGERPYSCMVEGCGWSFSTSSRLKRHLRKHTGERQWVCPHEGCKRAFMRAEHLRGHLITHSGGKPFACTEEGCMARFTAKSTLYVHLKKHKERKENPVTYFCPVEGCNRKYTTKASLHSHIEKHYGTGLQANPKKPVNTIIYFCPIEGCNQRYYTKSSLRSHIESHYATQMHNNLGVIPLLNVGEIHDQLDTLLKDRVYQMSSSKVGASGPASTGLVSLLTQTGVPVMTQMPQTVSTSGAEPASPVVYMAADGQLHISGDMTGSMESLLQPGTVFTLPAVSQGGELTDMGAQSVTTVPITTATPVLTTMDAGTTLNAEPSGEMMTRLNLAGSARTDEKSNQQLSEKAKRRQQLLRERSTLDFTVIDDFASLNKPTVTEHQPSVTSAPVMNPNEIMTSRAITFRDPETGAIYVQTQLLQDDPPDPEAFGDDPDLNPGMHCSLDPDLTSFLQGGVDGSDPNISSAFGSTINLQDLE